MIIFCLNFISLTFSDIFFISLNKPLLTSVRAFPLYKLGITRKFVIIAPQFSINPLFFYDNYVLFLTYLVSYLQLLYISAHSRPYLLISSPGHRHVSILLLLAHTRLQHNRNN